MIIMSFLLILLGTGAFSVAVVAITYLTVTSPEKNFFNPRKWAPGIRTWIKIGGAGLGSALMGMLAATFGVR